MIDSFPFSDEVVNSLTEAYAVKVVDIAKEHTGKGLMFTDILQEGNLALFFALKEFNDYVKTNPDKKISKHFSDSESNAEDKYKLFENHLEKEIIAGINAALDEASAIDDFAKDFATKANLLDELSVKLSEGKDTPPTIAELAKASGMTEDEVERIMKMSLDALNTII